MGVLPGEMPPVVAPQLHHVEPGRRPNVAILIFFFDGDVGDDVIRFQRTLRPGDRVQHAQLAHRHQVPVLGEDRRLAVQVL
jgi:hypothetical protein